MAVLRADQALAPDFFLHALPALEVQDVRLAQGRLAYPDLPPAADVFNVVRFNLSTSVIASPEPAHCCSGIASQGNGLL